MTPQSQQKLGRQLLSTVEDINGLIPVAKPEDREALRTTRAKLLDQLDELIEANIDSGSREYREATDGLRVASASVQNAINGLENIAKVIATLAKAVDLVAKVAVAA